MPIYRVTDEALIAETMVWPNSFLMNVFFALKGSKQFIIILKKSVKSIDTILNAKVLTNISKVNHRTRVESEETVPVCKFLLKNKNICQIINS